jgi:glucoamylase
MFFHRQSSISEPFSASEVSTMRGYFLQNINIDGKGGIVAAPDYNTPGGSYYYHWMRDGALTMRCLQETNTAGFASIEAIVKSYAQWVVHNQNEADPNGIDVRTEPKFMLPNGEVFSDPWCRPQNDGPGLRATTLIIAAQSLLAAGETDFVKQNLWTGSDNMLHGGAIKYDLDYVVTSYATNTCDLWEEIRDANFFWNRITMKKAMIVGAAFANQMGDSASAQRYLNTLNSINADLYKSHYNGQYVLESNSRPQDSAVIVGFNDGFDESDGLFAPTSLEVAQTVSSYNTLFCSEYSINTADSNSNVPGVLYGRYKGDTYAGGNPWVLSTAALANLFYRGASYILDRKSDLFLLLFCSSIVLLERERKWSMSDLSLSLTHTLSHTHSLFHSLKLFIDWVGSHRRSSKCRRIGHLEASVQQRQQLAHHGDCLGSSFCRARRRSDAKTAQTRVGQTVPPRRAD